MPATDAMIARLESELEERNTFVEGLVAGAEGASRDLTSPEMEMIATARERITTLGQQLTPLRETSRISIESRRRATEIDNELEGFRRRAGTGPVEYRSAGVYVADRYLALMGDHPAAERLEVFHRAAAHQTTADNPGLLPESIVGPVINLVDAARPLVAALGTIDLGSGSWAYARVTQHTQIGPQSAEKAELPSRKMLITKTPLSAPTLGGYVNVSRQDINRTSPAILDMVIADLGTEYAIESEKAAATAIDAAATASGGAPLPAAPTAAQVSQAIWSSAAEAYAAMRGQGRLILGVSPDMLGLVGPLFAPINPTNAQSSGFEAGSFGQGAVGAISGISVVMSSGFPAKTMDLINSAAVKLFEMRYGALQVAEPSVWGVQVGYAGDFQTIVTDPTGVVSVNVT